MRLHPSLGNSVDCLCNSFTPRWGNVERNGGEKQLQQVFEAGKSLWSLYLPTILLQLSFMLNVNHSDHYMCLLVCSSCLSCLTGSVGSTNQTLWILAMIQITVDTSNRVLENWCRAWNEGSPWKAAHHLSFSRLNYVPPWQTQFLPLCCVGPVNPLASSYRVKLSLKNQFLLNRKVAVF
jgi:hypothetical protein